jgi:hypothetical protein
MIQGMVRLSLLILLGTGAVGCASLRVWDRPPKTAVAVEAPSPTAAAEADHEARLRERVTRHISSAGTTPTFVRRKPYYFHEYEVYPEGPASATITLTEKDSLISPYLAEVQLPKQRYATRLHRKRGAARDDRNFFRETGTERLTYELRHGNWIRVGSLFTVDTTEEQVNGEWVQAQEEVQKVVRDESRQGLFGRTWSRVTGR